MVRGVLEKTERDRGRRKDTWDVWVVSALRLILLKTFIELQAGVEIRGVVGWLAGWQLSVQVNPNYSLESHKAAFCVFPASGLVARAQMG